MTKEIYENSVLDDSAEAIEEQETELCEDAARNVIGVVTDCLKLNIREKPNEEICSRQAVRRKRYGQYTDIDKKAARNC